MGKKGSLRDGTSKPQTKAKSYFCIQQSQYAAQMLKKKYRICSAPKDYPFHCRQCLAPLPPCKHSGRKKRKIKKREKGKSFIFRLTKLFSLSHYYYLYNTDI